MVVAGRSYHAEKGQISVIILSVIQVPRTSTDQKQVQLLLYNKRVNERKKGIGTMQYKDRRGEDDHER